MGTPTTGYRIALGADEATESVASLVAFLRGSGYAVDEIPRPQSWVAVGHQVGREVAAGRADFGIVLCHTGTGVALAANKVGGVRAALCHAADVAVGARRWNDANVLALALADTPAVRMCDIAAAFVSAVADRDTAEDIRELESPPDRLPS